MSQEGAFLSPFVAEKEPAALAAQFMASLREPQQAQAATLAAILRGAAASEFGKRHHFSQCHTVEAFRNHVPISSWDEYAAPIERMACGEQNVLFDGNTEQFLQTSGTLGRNKLFPLNQTALTISGLVTCIRTYFRQKAVQGAGLSGSVSNARVFLFPSPANVGSTAGGIPIGYASGQTTRRSAQAVQKMQLCPSFVHDVEDITVRQALLLYFALSCGDVVAAIGNNPRRFLALLQMAQSEKEQWPHAIASGRLEGISHDVKALPKNKERAHFLQALQREGAFWPRQYWPHMNLACFWLSGPMAPAVEALRPLLPEKTIFFDAGYGASELKINVPIMPNTPYAPPALFAGFFEFLPLNKNTPLLLHELQDGERYEILLTTYAGLYRYRLGDIVHVQGKTENTPNIAFYGRVSEEANICGERVAGAVLLKAAQKTCTELQVSMVAFCVYPSAKTGRYECYVELSHRQGLLPQWAVLFDEHVMQLASGYARRRKDGSLAPPCAMQLRTGWECFCPHKLHAEQVKPSLILKEPLPGKAVWEGCG